MHVSTECIKRTNEEVSSIPNDNQSNKRSPYLKAIPEQKAAIGRYPAENEVVTLIRRFPKDFPTKSPKECTVRGWKNVYLQELQSRK